MFKSGEESLGSRFLVRNRPLVRLNKNQKTLN